MRQTATAKELFDKMIEENDECTSTEMMIEFAKLHVEEALKAACEKADTQTIHCTHIQVVDKESILTSYSLKNIK